MQFRAYQRNDINYPAGLRRGDEMTCEICKMVGDTEDRFKGRVIITDGEEAFDVCDKCWNEILRVHGLPPAN